MNTETLATTRTAKSFAAALATPFTWLWNAAMAAQEAKSERLRREIAELENLTDHELARIGLRRDDIVRHVFRNRPFL